MTIYVGTSGWNYDHWKDRFYAGVRRQDWLRFYASCFDAVEINATFYRRQDVETFRRWRSATPDGFRFSIKANRYLTHNRKLTDPLPLVCEERDRARALEGKLAAVVWQLPMNFHENTERLRHFARALDHWRPTRHVIEFRHRSWFDENVADCLRHHRIGVCQSDAADWPMWDAVTTDIVYIRLHGHTRTYVSRYRTGTLDLWSKKILAWSSERRDVHVYFDNDAVCAAPRDALRLMKILGAWRQGDEARALDTAGGVDPVLPCLLSPGARARR